MVANNQDYDYIYNDGTAKKRKEVVDDILKFLGTQKLSMTPIANGIGLSYERTTSAVRWAKRHGIIHGVRRGRKYLFCAASALTEEDACLLADLFYNKEKILSNFKIKSRKKRRVEDAPNKSVMTKGAGVTYTQHVLNTVYE